MLERRRDELGRMGESIRQQMNRFREERLATFREQDSVGVSSESFSEVMKTLQSQRIQLMIDLAGLEARRDALREAEVRLEAEQQEGVVAPLKKILDFERKSLERVTMLHRQGSVSESDLIEAQKQVLKVEIQIAEARSSTRQGGRLSSNLLDTSLERAEKVARLEKVDSLLGTFTKARSTLDATVKLEQGIQSSVEQLDTLQREIHEIDARMSGLEDELAKLRK